MKDTYTLEDIEDAYRKGDRTWESMKEHLTRPPIKFAEGEVVAHPAGYAAVRGNTAISGGGISVNLSICKKQSTRSSGAQELLDALERICHDAAVVTERDCAKIAREALEKWRKDRGE